MPRREELTAVIVDWNLPDHTVRCAESLVHDGIEAGRIVVVENDPTPENWARIAAELSHCVRVRTTANVGFARAMNIGARALPGRAYLLVNNDTYVARAGAVAALVRALERPDVSIVVPRLLNEDGTLQPTVVPFTTALPALVRASGLSRLLPDRVQPRVGTHWRHSSSREIQAAMGAVMLVDGDAWESVGGLRETSFMYAEDIDLCWRVHKLGRKTWFESGAEFVHVSSATADRRWNARERWRQVGRSEGQVLREHLSRPSAVVALTLTRIGALARVAYFSITGDAEAAARYRGFMEGLAARGSAGTAASDVPARVEVFPPSG